MGREIFLAVPLLALIWRREYPVACCAKGCTAPAGHVLARLHAGETALPPGRLSANAYHRTSAWCPAHLGKALARRPVPVVETYEQAIALVRAMDEEAVAAAARYRAEHEARERAVLEAHGRILRGSGMAGTLYQRADCGWEVDLRDATGTRTKRVCCPRRGGWLIDTRHGNRRLGHPDEHSDDCPDRAPGATPSEGEPTP